MSNNTSSNSIGFTTLLLLVFIILKLCKVIEWSWWWVLSPLWISLLLILVVLAGIAVAVFLQAKSKKK